MNSEVLRILNVAYEALRAWEHWQTRATQAEAKLEALHQAWLVRELTQEDFNA